MTCTHSLGKDEEEEVWLCFPSSSPPFSSEAITGVDGREEDEEDGGEECPWCL